MYVLRSKRYQDFMYGRILEICLGLIAYEYNERFILSILGVYLGLQNETNY